MKQSLGDGGQRCDKLIADDSHILLSTKKTGVTLTPPPSVGLTGSDANRSHIDSSPLDDCVPAYLYLHVRVADGAVQLLLSELLSVDQILQQVVPQ